MVFKTAATIGSNSFVGAWAGNWFVQTGSKLKADFVFKDARPLAFAVPADDSHPPKLGVSVAM